MADRGPRITDEEARRLWQRAAELQVAAQRPSYETRSLEAAPADSLSLELVAAAAEGAGIDADYVRIALAERRLPDAESIDRERWTARWLRRVISDVDAVERTRHVAAPAARVLDVLGDVGGRPPFHLVPENRLGEDPVRDGVLVYRVAGGSFTSPFASALEMADARVLLVTLRTDGDGTRLRIRAPLFRRGLNLALGGATSGLAGAGASWGGWSLGGALAGLTGVASAAALLVPAGIGAVAGGAIGLGAYRALYRSLVRGGVGALDSLLAAVALDAEAGGRPHPDRLRTGEAS